MAISDYDATPASNSDISGINIAENCAAGNLNNAVRQIMADIAASPLHEDADTMRNGSNLEAQRLILQNGKSSDYTLVADDDGKIIRFTAAGTANLTAAATLGSRWSAFIVAGGGDVVVDPNGSENINNASTLSIPDGTFAHVYCNGSVFWAFGSAIEKEDKGTYRLIKAPTYVTASDATWAFDSNTKFAKITVVGAGGSGGYANPSASTEAAAGSGGNHGGILEKWVDVSSLSPKQAAIVIGAGGVGTTSTADDGEDTTCTVNVTTYTAQGGKGGSGSTGSQLNAGQVSTENDATTGGDFNNKGAAGGFGISAGERSDSAGTTGMAIGGNGGSSRFGVGGIGSGVFGSTASSFVGGDASGYGAGGGGACGMLGSGQDKAGGDGAGGLVIIEEYGF